MNRSSGGFGPHRVFCPLGLGTLLVCGCTILIAPDSDSAPASIPVPVDFIAPGWTLQVARQMPERVTALVTGPVPLKWGKYFGEYVYVGTGPIGSVYRFHSRLDDHPKVTTTIAVGLGDRLQFGTCNVNRLAIHDLDHDGTDELLAETSQIEPEGRPRLYIWNLGTSTILRGFARPHIRSRWGHGLGFIQPSSEGPTHIISTYCGYGEIVEYEPSRTTSTDGFQDETLAWRLLGKLPASGEGVQVADVDNDGESDLCLATGYAAGQAAIHVYTWSAKGIGNPKHVLDEGGEFGNVKFLVGDVRGDGTQELFAWWCVGLADGSSKVIRYLLGPDGLRERTEIAAGDSGDLWPIDGQMALADMDGDGVDEVWFATTSGNLWRYNPVQDPSPTQVCRIKAGIGPITPGCRESSSRSSLYLGSQKTVLQLQPSP